MNPQRTAYEQSHPYWASLHDYSFARYIRERDELIRDAHNADPPMSVRAIARAIDMSAAQICRILAKGS
jgi:hypothetical protein